MQWAVAQELRPAISCLQEREEEHKLSLATDWSLRVPLCVKTPAGSVRRPAQRIGQLGWERLTLRGSVARSGLGCTQPMLSAFHRRSLLTVPDTNRFLKILLIGFGDAFPASCKTNEEGTKNPLRTSRERVLEWEIRSEPGRKNVRGPLS